MLRFDGRVAVVTGAGRGLGRSHAMLLASRGASVVVNDLGGSRTGEGASPDPANEVVAEIIAAGGTAVANFDSVVDAPQAIVDTAIETFGKLDIVVNNAGINQIRPFDEDPVETIKHHMDVHFVGTAAVTAAAWPHLVASGSGRVVTTGSPTLFGFLKQTPYVSAKGALFAFTRTLAMEAAPVGIKVNSVAPAAYTRMIAELDAPDEVKKWASEKLLTSLVSPVVAYLAHEDCTITGETILAAGGRIQRMTLGQNEGYVNEQLTPEDVQENLDVILDPSTNEPAPMVGAEDAVRKGLPGRS